MTTALLDHPAPIVDDATRRQFLAGLAAAGLLAGCGSDPGAEPDAVGGDGAFPVRIEHQFGTTEILAEPRRIVTVGLNDHDAVLALGREPVAATEWYTDTLVNPWSQDVAGDVSFELLPFELNFERIAALEPDVIFAIYYELEDGQYDLLSAIAPTISGQPGSAPYGTPWQEQTRMIARAIGQEGRAQERIADVEAAFDEVTARHPEWDGATAALIGSFTGEGLYVYPPGSPTTSVLERLGFVPPARLDDIAPEIATNGGGRVSRELLAVLDTDLLLSAAYRADTEQSGLLSAPTFARLDVVREGRVILPLDAVADALSWGSALSVRWLVDKLEPMIVAAFDGDPATEIPG